MCVCKHFYCVVVVVVVIIVLCCCVGLIPTNQRRVFRGTQRIGTYVIDVFSDAYVVDHVMHA